MVAGCGDDSSSLECGANTTEVNGVCVADTTGTDITCGTGTVAMGTECVPDGSVICETGTTFDMASGSCVADITGCGTGTVVVDGECKDPADVTADVSEAAEPNDLGVDGTPGMIDLPIAGESITISGCIEPTTGMDGLAVIDDDAYIFEASGPTLLDITVDGFNGAAGAFTLQPLDAELNAADFLRFGVDLANDMSQRQVFLPKATGYAISFGDSRSVWFNEPAGGPGACYLATIRNVALPTPTAIVADTAHDGTYGSETQFLRLTPAADGSVATSITTAPGEGTLVDSVLMVNGEYLNSSNLNRNFGDPATNSGAGLNVADMVTYVIDPVINLPLNPVNFSHIVSEVGSTAIPTDGTTVSVPAPGDEADTTLDSYPSFVVANDGDVVYLDLDVSDLSTNIDWTILDNSLRDVSTIGVVSNGEETGYYRFAQAGTYFIDIRDGSGAAGPYDLTATQIDHTPTAVVVDTPFLAQTFGADKAAFYVATPGAFEWWNVTGTPTNFDGDMVLDVYPAAGRGKLGDEVAEVTTELLVGGVDNINLFQNAPPMLLKVSDDGGIAAPTATYDFSIANNPYNDLGFVDAATPANMVVTASGVDTYFIAQGNDGDVFNLAVTGNNGFDPQLVLIAGDGSETVVDLNTGADTAEFKFALVIDGVTPFLIRDAAGVGGDFTVDVTIVDLAAATPLTGVSVLTPPLDIPDNAAPVGITDIITLGACVAVEVTVDVDVSHTWIGDITMTVTSPAGTPVVLENASQGNIDDILGNYPTDFTPAESLNAYFGEDAAGNWSIELTDGASGDTGTLNSWGLNLMCL